MNSDSGLSRRLIPTLVLLNVLWAPVNLFVGIATRAGTSPTAVAMLRWPTLAILLGICLATPGFRRLTHARWPILPHALIGIVTGFLLFGPSHMLYYRALTQTSSVEGNALGTTGPIWVAVLSFLFLQERITWLRWAALGIGAVGAYIVSVGFGPVSLTTGHTAGNLTYLIAVLLESVAGVITAGLVRKSSGITMLFFEIVGAAMCLLILPALMPTELPVTIAPVPTTWWVTAYLVLVSGLFNFGIWYMLVERAPLSLMVVTLMLQPPLAALLGYFYANERVTPEILVGTGLILLALAAGAVDARSARIGTTEIAER